VEIVRAGFAAYNRRHVDGILENWAPDAVLDWSNSRGFDAGVYRGHDEIRAFMERFLATWDEVRIEIVDGPVEVEDGVLITENVAYLRARDGIDVEARSTLLVTIRDGEHRQVKAAALSGRRVWGFDTLGGWKLPVGDRMFGVCDGVPPS
jgi:ketosteroid isomerase-like protein